MNIAKKIKKVFCSGKKLQKNYKDTFQTETGREVLKDLMIYSKYFKIADVKSTNELLILEGRKQMMTKILDTLHADLSVREKIEMQQIFVADLNNENERSFLNG